MMDFSVDQENATIHVSREFAAPLPKVWAAWTESGLLDQWWAPKPWRAQTKTLDFREGGHWLYAMIGPDGETHWSRADFHAITPLESFTSSDAFCDEQGNVNPAFPRSHWTNAFRQTANATRVTIRIRYETLDQLQKIIEMGFKEGFTAGLENLDDLLDAASK